MSHAREGAPSKSDGNKMETWRMESKESHNSGSPSLYCLFTDAEHNHLNTAPLLEDTNKNGNARTDDHIQISNHGNNAPAVSTCGSSARFSCAPTMMQPSFYITSSAHRPLEGSLEDFADIMAVHQAFVCALQDPDQITPLKLLHKSLDALKSHYARDICLMSHFGDSSANAVTLQPHRIFGSSQMQFGGDDMNHLGGVQQNTRSPMDNSFSIICKKGQIASLCVNPHGSRLIQQALETATPDEIIMVYEEVIPYARMLTTDVFANHVVQKLLELAPQFYKRKFITNFIGHVLPLSLHMYGCRVIQKAFEVADHELKIQMANEFYGKVLKCACDQSANHVLQRCIECVPAEHIQFIFKSFCRKAKALSTTPYGCRVIQKALTFCSNPEIYQTLVSEIIEAVVKLASDPYANYVVQHVIEHGGPVERSTIVKKFIGRVLSMSYHKHASNVVEKCLTFGSFQDRRLITTEIFTAGDGRHFDHLLDMMCHLYANFVIKKLATVAEEGQLRVLAEVAHCNMGTIMKYSHGKQVLTHIQSVLTERGPIGLALAAEE